jgi:hypothetical protein
LNINNRLFITIHVAYYLCLLNFSVVSSVNRLGERFVSGNVLLVNTI